MDASNPSRKRHEGSSRTPSSDRERESREVLVKRRKVHRALVTFKNLFEKIVHEYKTYEPGNSKVKTKAMMDTIRRMRREHQWENTQKRVGPIIGIEVGDVFQYRVELSVIGLHQQICNGIDYKVIGNSSLATSIVVTDRYDNARKSNRTLVYEGQGGNPNVRGRNLSPIDQKLEGGNLALRNSMQARTPVRVILKISGKFDSAVSCISSNACYSYVYDGLYLVDSVTTERGRYGKLVFKFTLNRILGQPQTCAALNDNGEVSRQIERFAPRKRRKPRASVVPKKIVRVNDLSDGQEKFTVRVVTSSDCAQLPTSFEYVVNNIYSKKLMETIPCRFDSADGCADKGKCICFTKKGIREPNDCNKRLATTPMESSLILECGPSCKCSSCINRVSQHGVQFQLEIFLTELKGWGVRTRSFIPSGSFVCEYIGEVSCKLEAGWRLDNDYVFDMGVGKFFMNASKCGNIARFFNHSCCPNLHVKDVMYDPNGKNLPHKMLFAVKDIPAGRELTIDYNSFNGRFIKLKSNICYCGERECNGQIYI